HGKGSAIDASAVVFGGMNRVQGDDVRQLTLSPDHSLARSDGWYWVLHGTPVSKTGECVAKVRSLHGSNPAIWNEFTTCTNAFEKVIEDDSDPRDVIRENQRLLDHIGVVPIPSARFVSAVEETGGAAKISGAGAVSGDNGGAMVVYQPDHDAMIALMSKYPDRQWDRLQIAQEGARLTPAQPAMAAAQ
ncbi:MAG: GHMP kinase, partial [Pseudomonadota bacterium]